MSNAHWETDHHYNHRFHHTYHGGRQSYQSQICGLVWYKGYALLCPCSHQLDIRGHLESPQSPPADGVSLSYLPLFLTPVYNNGLSNTGCVLLPFCLSPAPPDSLEQHPVQHFGGRSWEEEWNPHHSSFCAGKTSSICQFSQDQN